MWLVGHVVEEPVPKPWPSKGVPNDADECTANKCPITAPSARLFMGHPHKQVDVFDVLISSLQLFNALKIPKIKCIKWNYLVYEALYQSKWLAFVFMKCQTNRDSSLRIISKFVHQWTDTSLHLLQFKFSLGKSIEKIIVWFRLIGNWLLRHPFKNFFCKVGLNFVLDMVPTFYRNQRLCDGDLHSVVWGQGT